MKNQSATNQKPSGTESPVSKCHFRLMRSPSISLKASPLKLNRTMIVLFIILALWSCLGCLFLLWDTGTREEIWSRSDDPLPTWIILVSGPIVWILYALFLVSLMLLYFYAR